MHPLEHLIDALIREVGTDTAFQAVYEAVNIAPESQQATQLTAALHAVTERKKQQELHRALMSEDLTQPWTL